MICGAPKTARAYRLRGMCWLFALTTMRDAPQGGSIATLMDVDADGIHVALPEAHEI